MHKLKTEKYFRVLVFVLMLITFLPVVSNRFPAYIGSPHLWAIIWGISLLFLKPKVLFNKMVLITLFYGLFLWIMLHTLWATMSSWNMRGLKNEYYEVILSMSFISYFHISKDYVGFAKITKYTLIFIGITAILTIYASIINPMVVRFSNLGNLEGDIATNLIFRFGVGGYDTAIALMSLVPVLIYYFKNNQQFFTHKKWIILVFLLIVFITILRMQIFANILVGILFGLLALLSVKNRLIYGIIIGFVVLMMTVISQSVYVETLNGLSKVTENTKEVSFKFKELAVYVETGGTKKNNEIAGRSARFPELAAVFANSPFVGCFYPPEALGYGYQGSGAHLYWMNKLTICGIFGFLFFISIIFGFIKNQVKTIKGEFQSYLMFGLMSIIIYGLFKNIGGRECWYVFFFILPGMYYLPLLKKKNQGTNQQDDSIQ